MALLKLINGKCSLVDDDLIDELSLFNWRILDWKGYVVRTDRIHGKWTTILLSRQIMGFPLCLQVDHINGDKLDNRRCNLRMVTNRQNQMNRKPRRCSRTGLKGVTYASGKYLARIVADNVRIRIGLYATAEEAAIAYDKKALECYGEYARTNFLKRGLVSDRQMRLL